MAGLVRLVSSVLLGFLLCGALAAQKLDGQAEIVAPKGYRPPVLQDSPALKILLDRAVGETVAMFPAGSFKPDEIAATLIDLRDQNSLRWANVRGGERIYPASVVKMFYLAALYRQLEDGKIKMSPELERGTRDMIVVSSNEATQYILDVITDTSSGAELPENLFTAWQYKRNRVNRYFASMGYTDINVNQKTFCEDAYGIEQQSRSYNGQNRNMLTTNATARLLTEIVLGKMANPEGTAAVLKLLKRDPFAADTKDEDDQAHGFSGRMLIGRKMTDAKLWSKAGWTGKARHDAAYIETADGLKFVLVVFTENHATEKGAIPMIAGKIIDGLREMKK